MQGSKRRIVSVELSFLAHATEDQDKVLQAVRNILPQEQIDNITFIKSKMKGEYGNPITLFKAQIRDHAAAEALVRNLSSNLLLTDREVLQHEFEHHVERGNLYLRFDKQAALLGETRLCRADPIRIRIRFNTSRLEELKEKCREIGILP
ncbi:MAG: RNA-binding domain-containing protein [Nitrososphaerota archaeon]|nr:exosome protein [Candidatus Bathyarchaeota archaeon]MDW8048617.1 RNA-binding domain-containing protein [Nitrososphaerota archaeon]